MKWKPKRTEIILICLPILVALSQIYFYQTSDLTSWKGGGFGMYSDAHPNSSRNIWIEGVTDSVHRSVRIHPIDERLGYGNMRYNQLYRDLRQLRRVARESQNFPSGPVLSSLKNEINHFLQDHKDDKIISELFPVEKINVVIVEMVLSKNFKSIEKRILSRRVL
jgi:hypothetical protein